MSRLLGFVGALAVVAVALAFAALNSGQFVTLHLGFATFYRVSLTTVAFVGLICGMLIMFGAGVRSDLKVRRILRARLREEDEEERARFVDRSQRDLFESTNAGDGGDERDRGASPPMESDREEPTGGERPTIEP